MDIAISGGGCLFVRYRGPVRDGPNLVLPLVEGQLHEESFGISYRRYIRALPATEEERGRRKPIRLPHFVGACAKSACRNASATDQVHSSSNSISQMKPPEPFLLRFAEPCRSPGRYAPPPTDYEYDDEAAMVRWTGASNRPFAIDAAGPTGPQTKKNDVEKGDDAKDYRMWR